MLGIGGFNQFVLGAFSHTSFGSLSFSLSLSLRFQRLRSSGEANLSLCLMLPIQPSIVHIVLERDELARSSNLECRLSSRAVLIAYSR